MRQSHCASENQPWSGQPGAPISAINGVMRMLGVLGGMGPRATIDFIEKIYRNTPAERDQDHIDMIVSSSASIPDRTEAIIGDGEDPFPAMLRALASLELAGARLVAIPCNTAHHWHGRLQAETPMPILHIVDAAARMLDCETTKRPTVGLLATDGTLAAGIYQDRLPARGYDCLTPDVPAQQQVMEGIRLVKAGMIAQAAILLRRQAEALRDCGADVIAMACTEVPVALSDVDGELRDALLDPTDALARASVEACLSAVRPSPLRDDDGFSSIKAGNS